MDQPYLCRRWLASALANPWRKERRIALPPIRLTARYARYLLASLATVAFVRSVPNN